MSRHTCRLLLPLLLALTTARGHKHGSEPSDEAAAAPIDSILWTHIFLQATVWGILFPIGMVFGLSRSRWHVPLQVILALSLLFVALLLTTVATSSDTRTAAGNSSRAQMASSPISSSRLRRNSRSACTSSYERTLRPWAVRAHGIVGKSYPVLGWTQLLFGAIVFRGYCRDGALPQCLAHYIMGGGFIAYGVFLAILLLVGELIVSFTGRESSTRLQSIVAVCGLLRTCSIRASLKQLLVAILMSCNAASWASCAGYSTATGPDSDLYACQSVQPPQTTPQPERGSPVPGRFSDQALPSATVGPVSRSEAKMQPRPEAGGEPLRVIQTSDIVDHHSRSHQGSAYFNKITPDVPNEMAGKPKKDTKLESYSTSVHVTHTSPLLRSSLLRLIYAFLLNPTSFSPSPSHFRHRESQPSHHQFTSAGPSTAHSVRTSLPPFFRRSATLYNVSSSSLGPFPHACPTRDLRDVNRIYTVLNTSFQVPFSVGEKKSRLQECIAGPYLSLISLLLGDSLPTAERARNSDPPQYLPTVQHIIENVLHYPVPSYLSDVLKKPDGWIETTQAATGVVSGAQTRLTQDAKALTRVCIIDFAINKTVYDHLVKSLSPIPDYLTSITPASLEPNTTTLADVTAQFRTIINTINDPARPLTRVRPIRTTAHHPLVLTLKPGLSWLTCKCLGRTIQDRKTSGYDPEEGCGCVYRKDNKFTSTAVPATTVACTNDAKILDIILGVLYAHQFVFAWLMGWADVAYSPSGVTHKAGLDCFGAGNIESPNSNPEKANRAYIPQLLPAPDHNVLLSSVTVLNDHLMALHVRSPRACDPRTMSALASRQVEHQVSQNQSGSAGRTGGNASLVWWSIYGWSACLWRQLSTRGWGCWLLMSKRMLINFGFLVVLCWFILYRK
ncbi:hypothetical protein BJV78DRAFT_1155645 [Lactifluus subvellereus]|nr:hypothetical protein BJV78DRAFT_1155645 [Lactifluus subvellereus]